MSPRTNLSLAVLVLLAVFTLFAAPSEAWAVTSFEIELDWNGFTPSDCEVQVIERNQGGDIVATHFLTPNSSFSLWSGEWLLNSQTTLIEVIWEEGLGGENEWRLLPNQNPVVPPIEVEIDQQNPPALIERAAQAH
ncbi:MAG: hypothetical protein FJY67_11785 [Calditrichaeota bacterium]|nr:hypothetical protein [Calditrichota bacterium]